MVTGTTVQETGTRSVLCSGAGCARRDENGEAPHRTLPGSRLCAACRDGFARELAILPELYDECGRMLAGSQHRPRERTSGGADTGIPFNVVAADARESIRGVLGSWSGMVAENRAVTAPRRTVGAAAEFLRRHLDWLAAHDTAAEATDEIARLVRRARRAAYPNPVHRVNVGHCVEDGCAGELVALMRPHDSSLPAEISCDTDPEHHWPAHQWMRLSRRMTGQSTASVDTGSGAATRWLSAADIARLWGVPAGTVYRLASERRWRRQGDRRRTRYHHDDVVRTFEQRTERP